MRGRHGGGVIFHVLGSDHGFLHAGQDVHLGSILDEGGVFLLHHDGAGQGRVRLLGLGRQSCGKEEGGEGDISNRKLHNGSAYKLSNRN